MPATEWRRPAALYCRLGSLRRGAHEFAAERRIASAIRPDLKHANTRLRQSGNQSREMRPIPHDDMSGSVGGTQAPELHFLRRGEELLERRVEFRHRQHFEDAAAMVVDEHDRQASVQFRREEKPIGVVQQGEVAG